MKHRVWRVGLKAWADELTLIDSQGILMFLRMGRLRKAKPSTNVVEYSTGLFDVNGTEIFEGDIVANPLFFPSVVAIHDGGVHFYDYSLLEYGDDSRNWEVVGNIHESDLSQFERLLGGPNGNR